MPVKVRKDFEEYFLSLLKEGKLIYKDGIIYRKWSAYNGWYLHVPMREIKDYHSSGYKILRNRGKNISNRWIMQHRLIWLYLKGPIPDDMYINHINGIRDDNRIENLELVTHQKNIEHAWRTGLFKKKRILNRQQYLEILELIKIGKNNTEIGKIYNIKPHHVSNIRVGKRITSYGYI